MKRNEEQKNNDKNSVAFHPMQVISEINNKSKTNDTSAKAKKKMHQWGNHLTVNRHQK